MSAAAPLPRTVAPLPQAWKRPLALLALAWFALVGLFFRDFADMAGQWWDSSTYNHVLLVPAILAWLVSQRWPQLRRLSPQGWWPALLPLAGGALLWLLGDFSGFSLARQLGVVVMAQSAVPLLLGPRVAAGLLFPFGYMLFLVPFGDELIPTLQQVTARLAMLLLRIAGGPATLDGVFITTPAGYFEVAEACSGVKFLIAMVAYGALVSNVCFRSWPRRIGFMALSLVIPVLANGVRAWGTIWLAGVFGIAFAAGFDHVFYGWVFFALVMACAMALGWRFFDRPVDDPFIDAAALEASPSLAGLARARIAGSVALAGAAAILALVFAWSAAATRIEAALPARIALPEVPGWTRVDLAQEARWQPLHTGADHRLFGRYADRAGHVVDVSFALYATQSEGREAGGFGQGALPLGSPWAWEGAGPAFADARADLLQAPGPVHRLAVTRYRTGDVLTGSNARLKLANIADRLRLRARPTAVLILSSEGEVSGAAIHAFERAAGGDPAAWMDRIAGGR
ncbi:exosortase A [Novosphingobium huizhouense]|uniref:exosortase A n=1 Tax=Novosphingobium huizhouense TaxID=2866625 RepID=UPI001CD8E9F5|nr:exosortase A [Novosphingobium huizhouense]